MAAPSLIGASADEALAVVRRDLNVLEAANGQATVAERRAASTTFIFSSRKTTVLP